jgi:hypothetical protein
MKTKDFDAMPFQALTVKGGRQMQQLGLFIRRVLDSRSLSPKQVYF